MNETLKTQIELACEMVTRGCKPVAMMPLQERYYNEIIKIIKKYNLFWGSEILSEGWRTIFIYRNKTMRYIIDELVHEPKTATDHYILGCIFGYDNDAICGYIEKYAELNEPNIM